MFLRGRITVQVHSTWFLVIDRIYRSGQHALKIPVPLLEQASTPIH